MLFFGCGIRPWLIGVNGRVNEQYQVLKERCAALMVRDLERVVQTQGYMDNMTDLGALVGDHVTQLLQQ